MASLPAGRQASPLQIIQYDRMGCGGEYNFVYIFIVNPNAIRSAFLAGLE